MNLRNTRSVLAAAVAAVLTACSGTSVQNALTPPTVTTTNPVTQSTLQFAVGTANIAGTLGLNTVVTLRQNAGSYVGASVLLDAPTITGPAGFTVPAAPDAYDDAGTPSISGSIITSLNQIIGGTYTPTTFDPAGLNPSFPYTGIASSNGFLPAGNNNSGALPNLQPYTLPFYAANNSTLVAAGAALPAPTSPGPSTALQLSYIGGPPAFAPPGHASTQDGTFPNGYRGYTLGFTDFAAAPAAGVYTLSVRIPTGISSSGTESYGTLTSTSTISLGTVLPVWTVPPTFVADAAGDGGGTIATNYPAGGGVTEEFVELVDLGTSTGAFPCAKVGSGPFYYTFQVTPGQATVPVPATLGPAGPGQTGTATICAGDGYAVYGFAVDYPLLEAGFPASNGKAAPAITSNATATADLTTSLPTVVGGLTSGSSGGLSISATHRNRR